MNFYGFLRLEIWSFDKQRSSEFTDDSNDNKKTLIWIWIIHNKTYKKLNNLTDCRGNKIRSRVNYDCPTLTQFIQLFFGDFSCPETLFAWFFSVTRIAKEFLYVRDFAKRAIKLLTQNACPRPDVPRRPVCKSKSIKS